MLRTAHVTAPPDCAALLRTNRLEVICRAAACPSAARAPPEVPAEHPVAELATKLEEAVKAAAPPAPPAESPTNTQLVHASCAVETAPPFCGEAEAELRQQDSS